MHHFAESIQNTKGDALTGYYVKAVDPDTESVVSIYGDESLTPIVSVSGVADAALVDDDGMASFWIDDGTYHLDIYGSDSTTFIRRIESLPMGIASALLESISELTFTTDNYIYGTGSNTAAVGTITAFGRSLVDDSDAATARTTLGATTVGGNLLTLTNPSAITFLRVNADNSVSALSAAAFRTAIGAGVGGGDLLAANNLSDVANAATARSNLGLAIGTNVQAYDADLAALAGVTSAADKVPYFTGSGTADVATLTSFARTLIDDADAATARATLGIGIGSAALLRGALAKKSANQLTVNFSTEAPVIFESEEYDTDSIHNFSSTVTITIATPGVVTWNAHGFRAGSTIVLSTTGALPTGLTAGTTYYIVSPTANTFQLSATPGGAAINTSGSQSGTHTATNYSVLRVPSGVTYVRIGFNIALGSVTSGTAVYTTLYKNGSQVSPGIQVHMSAPATTDWMSNAWSAILPVSAGDDFEVKVQSGADNSVTVYALNSWFAMEIIA